jgi:hypothetical protein
MTIASPPIASARRGSKPSRPTSGRASAPAGAPSPLFPGYLFVRVVDRWRAFERSLGLALVKFGAAPARCPDAEIAKLIARTDPDGVVRLPARR